MDIESVPGRQMGAGRAKVAREKKKKAQRESTYGREQHKVPGREISAMKGEHERAYDR